MNRLNTANTEPQKPDISNAAFPYVCYEKSDGNNEAVEESKREGPVELTEEQH